MSSDDPTGNSLGSPLRAPRFVAYLVVFIGCLFAIFYTYEASRESPGEQRKQTSQQSGQAASISAPSVEQPKVASSAAQAAAPPTSQPQEAASEPHAAAPLAAAAPAPSAPTQDQGVQSAASNEELELAFNGHCRECRSFVKDDDRLGPTLYGVVGRKAGTVPDFAYSDSVKGSGITWDEPTLNKWITDPNALIPGNNMGAIFGGVADPAEREKIISFLKQDTQLAAPGNQSKSP